MIFSLVIDSNGFVYVGGAFTVAGGVSTNGVAKWDGVSWSELGGANALNANFRINSILAISATEIYAGGQFTNAGGKRYVAKWNGTSWSELGGANALNAILNPVTQTAQIFEISHLVQFKIAHDKQLLVFDGL